MSTSTEARVIVSYPWLFNSLSGIQAASKLDDNYDEVNLGPVTIGAQILYASRTLVATDDSNFFLCLPTADMNLTMPSSMAANWSFYVSNQSATHTVTLLGSWMIAGQAVMNPVLPGNFGTLTNVKGGLAIFDGAQLTLYPSLFGDFGGGTANITTGQDSIAQFDTNHVIIHNLGNAAAILVGAYPNWNSGQPYITAQDANTITIEFPNECPITTGSLQWSVST